MLHSGRRAAERSPWSQRRRAFRGWEALEEVLYSPVGVPTGAADLAHCHHLVSVVDHMDHAVPTHANAVFVVEQLAAAIRELAEMLM